MSAVATDSSGKNGGGACWTICVPAAGGKAGATNFAEPRCLVPAFDGAFLSMRWKEALWDKFCTGAPQRRRRSVERYNIVKRA
jgi:hypothetical protein